jgi:hypothetical protein
MVPTFGTAHEGSNVVWHEVSIMTIYLTLYALLT